jgi:hypothetical protein
MFWPTLAQGIEAPCSKLQGIFEVQGSKEAQFPFCSLTPQQTAGNALAMHFHPPLTACVGVGKIQLSHGDGHPD